MTMHYRISDPDDVRDLGDQFAAWQAAGNPKATAWAVQPSQPSPDAVWSGGEWIVPVEAVPVSVTARQIRLWLVTHGVSLGAVDAAISAIPDSAQRESVRVEWEYAPYVERSHPMLVPLGAALGMTPGQIDAAFVEAARL